MNRPRRTDGSRVSGRAENGELHRRQEASFASMMEHVLHSDPFYRKKYRHLDLPRRGPALGDLATLPFTEKSELVADQEARTAQAQLRAETVGAAIDETLALLRRQIKTPDQERFMSEFVSSLRTRP